MTVQQKIDGSLLCGVCYPRMELPQTYTTAGYSALIEHVAEAHPERMNSQETK